MTDSSVGYKKYQVSLGHLIVPENKEVLQDSWERVLRTQKPAWRRSPTGPVWVNLRIKNTMSLIDRSIKRLFINVSDVKRKTTTATSKRVMRLF